MKLPVLATLLALSTLDSLTVITLNHPAPQLTAIQLAADSS